MPFIKSSFKVTTPNVIKVNHLREAGIKKKKGRPAGKLYRLENMAPSLREVSGSAWNW